VGKVADEELVDKVNGPEDIVDDQQDQGVVVVPADHQGIEPQNGVEYAGIAIVHTPYVIKSMPISGKSLLAEAF
jgi:hypothetical protein